MKPANLSEDRHIYWPRTRAAGYVPDLGDDHLCRNCGYNLRGLERDSRCPECGAVFGIDPFIDPLPWDQKQTIGTFISTLLGVLFSPIDLAGQIWHGDVIDGIAAIRFRRICIIIAAMFLCPVSVLLVGQAIGWTGAMMCAPIIAIAIIVWLQQFTGDSIAFFNDKSHGSPQRRAKALARYTAAPLALMPIHLLLLTFTFEAPTYGVNGLIAAGAAHVLLLMGQLLAAAVAEAALLWQLVELSRGAAVAITFANLIGRLFYAAIYLVAIPWLLAVMAKSIVGG